MNMISMAEEMAGSAEKYSYDKFRLKYVKRGKKVDKKDYPEVKLPQWIGNHLNLYGNCFIDPEIYHDLGETGLKETIKKQFDIDVIVKVSAYWNCIATVLE